ncbi:MAG: DEAD/DEAH box helicase family protein [Chlamydiales bacterium]|nr:DEAD/DEAH box helicase family protein [Chlamydiales bacterium]
MIGQSRGFHAGQNVNFSTDSAITRQLLTLPTGSGKTIIMGALAKALGKRTLLLAHREELITQAVDKFNMVWPEAEKGICMANQDDPNKQVVFGSIQTCYRPQRLEQIQKNGFELLLIDEAHHANSESYQTIIRGLGFDTGDKNRLMVGVTATPMRSDEKELGRLCPENCAKTLGV